MKKTIQLDTFTTNTRPDLNINAQMPGAFIKTKDGIQPDLNDTAMAERLKNTANRELKDTDEVKEEPSSNE